MSELDLSIIKSNELSSDFRLDAEYYGPHFIELNNQLEEEEFTLFEDLIKKMRRNPMAYGFDYEENGIPYLRISDLHNPIIDYSHVEFINEEINSNLKSTQLIFNDIVMAVRGNTIGRLGVYKGEDNKANISPNLIIFRLEDPNLSNYISIFLKTKYGRGQINRILSGTGQPTITSALLKKIKIPLFSDEFLKKINKVTEQGFKFWDKAIKEFYKSENNLIKELNLSNWESEKKEFELANRNFEIEKNCSIKSKQTIIAEKRIDAEFFQLKYYQLIEEIKKYSNGYEQLKELVKINSKRFIPQNDKRYKYIELSNINEFTGEIMGCTKKMGKNLPTRARRKVKEGDIIISSVEGSISNCALITSEYDNALCSTGFFVIKPNKLNSSSLLCLLKSFVGKEQLIRGCSGTILTSINEHSLKKIILPNLDDALQEKLNKNITLVYKNTRNSKNSFEIAKKAIEIAIEKNEREAEKYLEKIV